MVAGERQTYTFLFTDVEGSTRRWESNPGEMRGALEAHDRTLRAAVAAHHGTVFKHTGDGVCAVFASPTEATLAAIDAQRRLVLPVRMAIHTGEAISRDEDFFGVTLNRCAGRSPMRRFQRARLASIIDNGRGPDRGRGARAWSGGTRGAGVRRPTGRGILSDRLCRIGLQGP
jgi:hypothetical protein